MFHSPLPQKGWIRHSVIIYIYNTDAVERIDNGSKFFLLYIETVAPTAIRLGYTRITVAHFVFFLFTYFHIVLTASS